MKKIIYTTFGETLHFIRKVGITGSFLPPPKRRLASAQKAFRSDTDDWVVGYALAELYATYGRFGDAVRVLRRCVALRPDELRCACALALSYMGSMLRDAGSEPEGRVRASPLSDLGLNDRQVAKEATRWFRRSLALGPDAEGRADMTRKLALLQTHLEVQGSQEAP